MAYRGVGMLEVKEVLRLWLAAVPKKRIAATLGLDRKTVRRYVTLAMAHGLVPGPHSEDVLADERLAPILTALQSGIGRPHGEGWERCVEHRAFIEDKLQAVKLSKVRRLLLRQGVEVPYATLHRFAVAELGFGGRGATIPIADGEPGSEVQLDTGWVGALGPDLFGKRRRFRAWIFTAVVSRHRFVWPVFRETTETAIMACEEAWDHFGGIFLVPVPDNTRTIVDVADPRGARINAAFLEYAQHRGFHIDPARVRRATDKARVERAVQTVRDDCFGGEVFQTLEDAQRHARQWARDEYGMRPHSSTRRRPLEYFETEERPQLLPAPTERYDIPLWCEPKVARDQQAQVDRAHYSLPTVYVGKKLRARADRSTVRFYSGVVLVKTHARVLPGRRVTDPTDFPPEKAAYAMRDIDFLKRRAAEHGPEVGQLAARLLDDPLPWTRMRQVYALLSLAPKFPPAPPTPSSPPVIPIARYLRAPSQYALPLAPRRDDQPPSSLLRRLTHDAHRPAGPRPPQCAAAPQALPDD